MDNKKQLRNILVYLGIPILLFIIIFMMMNGSRTPQTTVRYSDILSYFDEGKVSEYTLDWGTGDLLLTLNDRHTESLIYRRKIHNVQRNFRISDYSYVISGKNSRVGDTEMYGIGLTKAQYEKIESNVKASQNKNLSQSDLFAPGIVRNPLLIIYPVELKIGEKVKKDEPSKIPALERVLSIAGTKPYVAIGMGFPCAVGEKPIEYVYTMNSTKRRELIEADEDFSTEDNEEEIDE